MLSWPSWLTCSGQFTHIVVTRQLQAERRTGSVTVTKEILVFVQTFGSSLSHLNLDSDLGIFYGILQHCKTGLRLAEITYN